MEKCCTTILFLCLLFHRVTLEKSIYCDCRRVRSLTCLGHMAVKMKPNVNKNHFNISFICPEGSDLRLFKFNSTQLHHILEEVNLSQIVSLKIARSEQFRVNGKTFSNAKNVQDLVLSSLNLQSLNPNMFKNIQQLRKLSIFGNNINKLGKNDFNYTR